MSSCSKRRVPTTPIRTAAQRRLLDRAADTALRPSSQAGRLYSNKSCCVAVFNDFRKTGAYTKWVRQKRGDQGNLRFALDDLFRFQNGEQGFGQILVFTNQPRRCYEVSGEMTLIIVRKTWVSNVLYWRPAWLPMPLL